MMLNLTQLVTTYAHCHVLFSLATQLQRATSVKVESSTHGTASQAVFAFLHVNVRKSFRSPTSWSQIVASCLTILS